MEFVSRQGRFFNDFLKLRRFFSEYIKATLSLFDNTIIKNAILVPGQLQLKIVP